jgi:hypothetical protein
VTPRGKFIQLGLKVPVRAAAGGCCAAARSAACEIFPVAFLTFYLHPSFIYPK